MNPRNGLLLTALHEKAFDEGIFTLNDDLTVRISQNYTGINDSGINDSYFMESIEGYEGLAIRLPQKFSPDRDLLSYHRPHIFQG